MAISVTCPSCLKRFSVSEKFAGKEGPCPNCQKPIKIPEKADEVVIHAPKDSGPTDSTGKSILKPIKRSETNIGVPIIVGGVVVAASVFAIALGLGMAGEQPPTWLLVIGALVIAAPLAFLGYWFLHDDELEGYNGRQLLVRCAIVAVGFASLWAVYGYLPRYVADYATMAEYSAMDMAIYFPIMIVMGAGISVLALELEIVQGVLHYIFYLGVSFVLAWLAGTPMSEALSGNSAPSREPPAIVVPGQEPSPVPPEPKPKVPNLLQ